MEAIVKKILNLAEERKITKDEAKEMLKGLQNQSQQPDQDIAVIGMAGRFPRADSVNEFWQNLLAGRNCIGLLPELRQKDCNPLVKAYLGVDSFDPAKVYKSGGYLNDTAQFDTGFFRISPREALVMEPAQRLFLQVAWEAIEDAGFGGEQLVGSNTGVFVGRDHSNESTYKKLLPEVDTLAATGSWTGILASRIAYIFDFQGPSVVVDTACSSGLVAVHEACKALQLKDCELAIAGGVFVEVFSTQGSKQLAMVESADYTVRSFDKYANGTIWGEGIGAVMLKPLKKALADDDPIHAVIRGSAINNDGASNGITAPKAEAQEQVILQAWKNARVNPETITYVEAHGTGTILGDPIEIKGLTSAFRQFTDKKQFCGIGSCKTNIGHLVGASGIASFIKMVLCVKHGLIPASLNFTAPNTYIDFCDSPLYVNDRLQGWKTDGFPRRGGVSAYGFSGTNCHIVIEEPPAVEPLPDETQPQIVAISARSGEILHTFVQHYRQWVEEHPVINLADVCYTINTGRGHFTHRLVLIVRDRDDLFARLSRIAAQGLHSDPAANIFYGEHKVVNASKENREAGEITEGERRELSMEGGRRLEEFIATGQGMAAVAEIYVQGAEMDWSRMYAGKKRQRLHLPTYPFEQTRYWPPIIPEIALESKRGRRAPEKEIAHPLLDRCIADSIHQEIYVTTFSVDRHWVLRDHKVLGNYVVPGTTYIELIREVVKKYYPDWSFELSDFYFMTPLMVNEGEPRQIQTVLQRREGNMEFIIASKDEVSEEWTVHAQGRIIPCTRPANMRMDLETLKAKFTKIQEVEPKEVKGSFELGPRWSCFRRMYFGENDILLFMRVQDQFKDDLNEFLIHPALMDVAVNSFSQALGDGIYLPFCYKSLKLYGRMPERFYSYMRLVDKTDSTEMFSANITLTDESGQVFAEISDYKVKKVRASDLKVKKNLYHTVHWLETPLAGENARSLQNQKILVIHDESGLGQSLAAELRKQGSTVFEADYGAAYADAGNGRYTITGTEDDYLDLFTRLKEHGLSMILHLGTVNGGLEVKEVSELVAFQQRGVKSLFAITRAISKAKIKDPVEIVLITEGVNPVTGAETICPHNAAMVGLGKIVGQEVQNLRVRVIDLEPQMPEAETLQVTLRELTVLNNPYQVSYRGGKRYTEEIQRFKIDELPAAELAIRTDGIYLITGGTGGIGLEVARYLAAKDKVNLAFVNRTPLPMRANWDEIIEIGSDEKLCAKLKAVREIEEAGARVVPCAASVDSYEEMAVVISGLRQQFGRINGIVHAAGVAGDGFLLRKEEGVFDGVLAPKMQGTWIIDQLTRVDRPDFFVLCSSISSLMAGVGQSDYVAANSYLDAFAAYRKQAGLPTVAIDWAAWKETGMAVEYKVNTEMGIFRGLTTNQAMMAFQEILERGISRIVVGELNYQHDIFANLERFPMQLAPDIKEAVTRARRRSQSAKPAVKGEVKRKEVQMKGRADGQYSAIERDLASIWGEVLVLDEIDIYEDFYAMGGDSIIAIKLTNAIKSVANARIDTSDIFEHQTIASFAAYLEQQQSAGAGEQAAAVQVTEPVEEVRTFPLSNTQQRIWFLQKYNKGMTAYNLPRSFRIDGPLDLVELQWAVDLLMHRHSALRTVFVEVDGLPMQMVLPKVELPIEVVDLKMEENPEKALDRCIHLENQKPFDLSKPLIKIIVYLMNPNLSTIYLNIHHIITDGWSMGVFGQELAVLYLNHKEGRTVQLPSLSIRYEDWLRKQAEWLALPERQEAENYWLTEMQKPLPVLNLPTDYPRPHELTYNGSFFYQSLGTELSRQLKERVRQQGTTLHIFFLSAYFLLLRKLTQDEEMIVGVPTAGRDTQELENVFGLFINMLPIRVGFAGLRRFTDLLGSVKEKSMYSLKYGKYPFDLLVNQLNPERDSSRSPIFSTTFQFFNMAVSSQDGVSLYDLSMHCREEDGEILVKYEYRTDLFAKESMQRFASYFMQILQQVHADPQIALADVRMITEGEWRQILEEFNATAADYPADQTLPALFEAQVRQNPARTAAVFGDQSVTYGELNGRANRLARTLRQRGVETGSIVGLMAERSLEMIIGIYGILKAGGAYLPIDPTYPADRIRFMLEDSRAAVLLTQRKWAEGIQPADAVLFLDDEAAYASDGSNPAPFAQASDLAYIIYTSGSTGKPKGVMLEHHSVVNRLNWMQKKYPLTEEDTILQKTPFTFDVSVWELFWWSLEGAKAVFLAPGGEKDPESIAAAIERYQVTTIHFVPSMLHAFLAYAGTGSVLERVRSLRRVFASGEALPPQQVEAFLQTLARVNGTSLHNLYGPTEATVDVTYFDCTADWALPVIPIGKPIDNTAIYIMDSDLQLQPVGIQGELCIAGANLARGYLQRPELTQEKFVLLPTGERIYRTGDLARWMPDGNIEYLGRIDQQVKIRGNRIEPGEIESLLLEYRSIRNAVVIDRNDADGVKYLCAYLVSEEEVTVGELREFLSGRLPEYMIPSYFVRVEAIPVTANGKVDRKALPEPDGKIVTGRRYIAPADEVEEKLAAIWSEVLNVSHMGVEDHFFELGGHSLKATVLVGRIHKEFDVEMPLSEVFKSPTIRGMSGYIQNAGKHAYQAIRKVEEREYYEVSSAQKRMYMLHQFAVQSVGYNLPGVLRMKGNLNLRQIEDVFRQLIQRHETLRTSFTTVGDTIVQRIHNDVAFAVEYFEEAGQTAEEIVQGFVRPFDLSKAPLLRVGVIRQEEEYILMFDMHHIISDGASLGILFQEFTALYAGQPLEPLRVQYKDFAEWQNTLLHSDRMKEQEEYWLQRLGGEIPVLNLSADYPRPAIQSFAGDQVRIKLGEELTASLERLAKDTGSTLYMVLLAGLNVLLSKYSGQDDIIIGSPIAGRQHHDLEKIIGVFVNTLTMRNHPAGEKTFTEFLRDVRANALAAYENQDYQFEEIVDRLSLRRDLSCNPLFDVMFVLQNTDSRGVRLKDITLSPYRYESRTSKFDLNLQASEEGTGISLVMDYCTRLFKRASIERMMVHLERIFTIVTADPTVRLREIDMVTEEERVRILDEWNDTAADYPADQTLSALFEAQAARIPDRIAARFGDETITYGELNARANRLAGTLRQRGVQSGSIAGIMAERSLEMLVGIYGILKAGGAYLPIDPAYPAERIRFMLEDSKAVVLLTQSKFGVNLPASNMVLSLDEEESYAADSANPEPAARPGDLAYIIYTSGSTGKPKGVMIEHHSVVNRLNWMQKKYPLTEEDLILQKTPFTFDVSVWEIFWWALQGAQVLFLTPGGEKDPETIVKAVEEHQVTTIHFVPSMLQAFLGYLAADQVLPRVQSLKRVFASGEALLRQQVEAFNQTLYQVNGTQLHNLYGPTEATVDVTYFDCSAGQDLSVIPIGKPIDNTSIYILDQNLQLQPVGVPGELGIAGVNLARGYLQRPELTAEKFVLLPSGERIYRTGDLARWMPDGNIEYLGRVDQQVKIRGFRIEMGEIEAALSTFPGMKEAAVVDGKDETGSYLCAYLVIDEEPVVTELREHLGKTLPYYMIPAHFVRLEQLPLTSNGKLDRRALPKPDGNLRTRHEQVLPRNEIETRIANLWAAALGKEIDRIGIHDSFFDLGGNSITLLRLNRLLNTEFEREFMITDLFRYNTIEELAAALTGEEEDDDSVKITF